jgi:hypothetical protein
MLVAMIAHAKTRVFPTIPRIINVKDVTPEIIQAMLLVKDSNTAIECKEGEEVPIEFLVNLTNLGFFSAHLDRSLTFKAEQTYYIRLYKQIPLLSLDLINWDKPRKYLGRKVQQM